MARQGSATRTVAPDPVRQTCTAMATKVLIVDDHPSFRASARLLLESEGFDIVGEAADGSTAIEKTSQLAPDVVLLDVQLPDIDGFEVSARVTSGHHAPVVVLTSSREGSDFGTLVERSGARGFVAKGELCGDSLRAVLGA